MRVLADTNVLASAFGTRGLCAEVLEEILLLHELLVCDEVLVELERTLRVSFRVPAEDVAEVLEFLERRGEGVSSSPLLSLTLKDAGDRAIVSAAANGKADLLVTGDREVLGLGNRAGVRILSPRAFLETVGRAGGRGKV